jgi:hypothetical protein
MTIFLYKSHIFLIYRSIWPTRMKDIKLDEVNNKVNILDIDQYSGDHESHNETLRNLFAAIGF